MDPRTYHAGRRHNDNPFQDTRQTNDRWDYFHCLLMDEKQRYEEIK